jgi:type VI secretion system protein ImpC
MPYAVGQARPLRWLVAAPFSVPPTGRFVSATGEQFRAVMSRLGPWASVEIPAGLAAGQSRGFRLEFQRPRDFRLAEVIKVIEPLGRLWDAAEELERGGKLDAALAKVRAAVGEGPLLREAQQLIDGGASAAPAPDVPSASTAAQAPAAVAPAPAAGGSALDAIFGKADLAPSVSDDAATAAKSGLDAFIGAMRSKGEVKASVSKPADRALAKQVAELLRRAAESAALGVMASPAVATLESSWQGLRMVVSHSPGSGDLAIDLLDTDVDGLVSRLRPRLDVEPMDRPDAVFVALPIADPETLRALAELGARAFVPIIVEVPDAASGTHLDDRAELPPLPEAWAELRREPASQWLCAASNAVVLANEEAGGTRRIVFGSPVWGLATMLSASVGQTGGPGHVFGRAGALVSPASHDVGHGHTVATRQPAGVDQQRALAERGVLVLGSERGSDRLRLAAAPTVHAGGDDLQLPGRILAGRAARFTRAVRDELPPHATDREVAARLAEAATNFLPRGPRGAVALQVRTDEHGKLAVDASINAVLAGASFEFSSDL